MTRWKNRRILAFVLAASLLFQEAPMTVLATGEKSTATEQEEKDTANNKEQEKENESQNTDKADKVEENEQNQQNQSENKSENSSQQTTDQEEPAEDAEPTPTANGDNMVVNGAVSLSTSEDFIKLSNQEASTYETATITITRNVAFDLTSTSDGKQFRGFGSAERPFRGHIVITNASSGIEIPLNRSFFNYLDQSATIDEGLYLEAKGKCESPLLAENYTNTNNANQQTIVLKINAVEAVTGGDKSFGGLIGNMAAGSQLSLKVDNQSQAGTNISGNANLGFFCNTMENGSSLTIASYQGDQEYVVSTTNGHAGGLVGEMCDGAQLTVTPRLTLTGNVTGTGAVGGLVGKATDSTITLSDEVTCTGTIEAGQGQNTATGGFVGMAIYKKKSLSLDFEKFHSNVTLGNGNHAGGLFGVLNYDCVNGGEIQITNADIGVTLSGSSWQFGGIIGQYSANSQKSSLKIVSPKVTITQSGNTSSFGGVIGYIAGQTAGDSLGTDQPSYVEINGATVNAKATDSSTCTDGRFGGLVAELGEQGHFLSVTGEVKVSSDTVGDKVPGLGGILGKAKNGVLRISGSTDLSGLKFGKSGNTYGQIAGDVDGTVIYALGSGNGNGEGTYGWKYIRPESAPVSDIGSYGEVIRLDGSKLTESGTSEQSDSTLFQYDANAHTVKVCYNATPSSLSVNNVRDLVALSVITQTELTSSTGAYLCDTISSPLTKNITISSRMEIDLSGTGCIGLLRDNGKQQYSGMFEGNGATIKLATGEAYGFQTKDTLAVNADGKSTNPGIGQIYNHPTIGFIPYCNGKVNNLNLSGSIYFNNVDGGEQVSCGALAGRTDGTSITNTVVNTSIVYNDGKGGSKLANVYAGGYIGSTTKDKADISFSKCSMQGKISSTSNCEHYAIGGYVAYIKANNTKVSVTDCELKNTKIEFKRTANGNAQHAKMGGVIGYIGLSKNTHNVTIAGLTIDGCKMSSDADGTAGGFFGYQWFGTNVDLKDVTVKGSKLDTKGIFGGLVYQTSGYWKIGDGTTAGITFQGSNTLKGKTSKDSPSALLVADTSGVTQSSGTSGDADNGNAKTYLEILKYGLKINSGSVSVTLDGGNNEGNFFDDIAGKTKYSDNISSVVSIGLTSQSADKAELIDQSGCNTWHNQCAVNGKSDYTNGNTRYYYNVDYYRAKAGNSVDNINTPGKLLLWSLNRYTSGTSNLSGYFKTGGSITGEIDLTGVSYYPVAACVDINNATITFNYSAMNEKESGNKQYSDSDLQHYQMQTGLFSKVTTPSKDPVVLTVNHLTLQGDVGVYADNKAGVLICDTVQGKESGLKVTMNLSDITLDGVYTAKDKDKKYPLLINSIGSYSAVNIAGVKVSGYASDKKAGSALLGTVGSVEGKEITLDFSDMGLNGTKDQSIFSQASFALSFQYGDEVSGGSYNFETTTENVTYGVEISNGHDRGTSHKHNRNSYNQDDGTGQVWYLDTFGQQDGNVYVSKDGASETITDFTVDKYLPYIGAWENKDTDQTYHELDVNQMTVYMVEGCGTYGDPYHIKSVTNGNDTIFTGADQLTALMKILDGKGSGTAVCINPGILDTKFKNAQQEPDIHTRDTATEKGDRVFIKSGAKWYAATSIESGGRIRYTKDTSSNTSYDNEQIVAYLRNAYYQIDEDIELNMARFAGIGGSSTSSAFSGVIIGNKEKVPTITLTGTPKTGATGGLVRYSQGSVIKDLTVNINGVTVTDMSGTDKFFGGVIGYVIGGDNIIDNVAVNVEGSGLTIANDNAKLWPVGGYVGLVGGADCEKGGGVVFRNMASHPVLMSVNTEKGSVAVNTEAADGNVYYYWNPYIGRVLDGFACSEGTALNNTDKNYTIPTLDPAQKLSISAKNGTDSVNGYTIYDKSQITVDSAQDLWVLSAIINSGYGAKATNGYYKQDPKEEQAVSDASYYGHVRTGKYDKVGTAECDAVDDEKDYWGGKLWNDQLQEHRTDHRSPSKAYLTSTYVEAQDTTAQNYEIASYLTYDKEYRSLRFVGGNYDLSSYGNGFRGIGQGYMVNGTETTSKEYVPTKLRALRMGNRNNDLAVIGNGATITYKRNILEYDNDTYSVKQAGLFPQFYCQADYTVQNIALENCNIKSNVLRNDTRFGLLYANDAYTGGNNVTFGSINISNSNIDGGYHSGGIFAYDQQKHVTINYKDCKIDNMSIVNAMYSGAYAGVSNTTTKTTVSFDNADTDDNVKEVKINTRNIDAAKRAALRAGVLFGQTNNLLVNRIKEKDCEIRFHLRSKESNDQSYTQSSPQFGGIAGATEGVTVTDTTVDGLAAICHGDVGGIVGNCSKGSFNVQNVEVSNSKIVEKKSSGGVGALAGNVSANVNGFDVLSNNNLVGYLVDSGYNDVDCSTVKGADGDIDLTKLSTDNVGLRISHNSTMYYSYSNISSMGDPTDTRCGIWVGIRSSGDIKIVAASRIGAYSAMCNVGRLEGTATSKNSYVIYADYQGTNKEASAIHVSPDNGILQNGPSLTGDGAALRTDDVSSQKDKALIKKIVAESTDANKMFAYRGGTQDNNLTSVIQKFEAGSDYDKLITTYKTEEPSSAYAATDANDIPILVLQTESADTLTSLLKSYTSVLTNMNQEAKDLYTVEPRTYVYKDGTWTDAGDANQTMSLNKSKQLRINPGKFDNTKNQITILDVAYKSPVNANDVYHLYIPVLVKKIMNVSFDIKMTNGAAGYASAYPSSSTSTAANALLAGYGDDFTADISFTYDWTVGEWKDALENGSSLLWSYDKKINIGKADVLNTEDTHLTLVDMNTHGAGASYWQLYGTSLEKADSNYVLDLNKAIQSKGCQGTYICDLLDLKVSAGTNEKPGKFKKLSADDISTATVRVWNGTAYDYYVLKSEDENDGTYYNIEINSGTALGDTSSLKVTESYYLVVNCTKGSGMSNEKMTLASISGTADQIPVRKQQLSGQTDSYIYVLGDFYKDTALAVRTSAKVSGSQIMQAAANDYIDATVSSKVEVAVSADVQKDVEQYVTSRPIYYQYAMQMVDESTQPVDIMGNIVVSSVSLKKGDSTVNLQQRSDLNADGFVVTRSGSVCYITMRTSGRNYMNADISANIRLEYPDAASLNAQFPLKNTTGGTDTIGVQFKANSAMAYLNDNLGSSSMSQHTDVERKLYYREDKSEATISYDSYNISQEDGNTSQLGLNGRETNDQSEQITSRAFFDARQIPGFDQTSEINGKYPYYFEGTLSLEKKNNDGTYESVDISSYLKDFFEKESAVDTESSGLGAQNNVFKFRMKLSEKQVNEIYINQILIPIDYKVKTGKGLEDITGSQYANYKVTLTGVLKNKDGTELTNKPTDYLVYTNAKVYQKIVDFNDGTK